MYNGQGYFYARHIYKNIIESICGKIQFVAFKRQKIAVVGFFINEKVEITKREQYFLEHEFNIRIEGNGEICIRHGNISNVCHLFLNTELFYWREERGVFLSGDQPTCFIDLDDTNTPDKFMCAVKRCGCDPDKCASRVALLAMPDGTIRLKRFLHKDGQTHHQSHDSHPVGLGLNEIKIKNMGKEYQLLLKAEKAKNLEQFDGNITRTLFRGGGHKFRMYQMFSCWLAHNGKSCCKRLKKNDSPIGKDEITIGQSYNKI